MAALVFGAKIGFLMSRMEMKSLPPSFLSSCGWTNKIDRMERLTGEKKQFNFEPIGDLKIMLGE